MITPLEGNAIILKENIINTKTGEILASAGDKLKICKVLLDEDEVCVRVKKSKSAIGFIISIEDDIADDVKNFDENTIIEFFKKKG